MERAIIGAGGFADEVKAQIGNNDMLSFVDDPFFHKISNNNFIRPLSKFEPKKFEVIICIGDSFVREKIVNKLPPETKYFTFIHHTAQILSKNVIIGVGSIICAGVIITTNCIIGRHAIINLASSIGHNTQIGDFFTASPGSRISGNCNIGNRVFMGTNSSIRDRISICNDVIIGMNAGVIKNISIEGTYLGLPAKILQ